MVWNLFIGENGNIVEYFLDHNHEANLQKLSRQAISNSVKRKATEDLFERPSKLINSELGTSSYSSNVTVDDIECIRKVVWQNRTKSLPPLPKNIDVHDALSSIKIVTSKNENFLIENDKENNVAIFSCKTNLDVLSESETILLDGTFRYCAAFFLQLFTIHCVINNNYIPLVFCLLTGKKEELYESLFTKIKKLCPNLRPKRILVDFEKAIHNAVEKIWTESKIFGCRFHLGQSWYRKIQQLGLSRVFQDLKSDDGKWLKHLFGLSYLSADDVGDCFVNDFMESIPSDPRIKKFADYIVDTYVDNESLFPPEKWASYSNYEQVTTNPCESFHSHFNGCFYKSHPNIYLFVNKLVELQNRIYIKIQSRHKRAKITNPEYLKSLKRVKASMKLLEKNEISKFQFVKAASYRYSRKKKSGGK